MDESLHEMSIVKRSDCTLYNLIVWYNQQPVGTRVAILVKDFEMCQETVLQNFILLLRFAFKVIISHIYINLNNLNFTVLI